MLLVEDITWLQLRVSEICTRVLASKDHCSESGRVFSWGIGTDGQCGRLKMESIETKQRIFMFAPGEVKAIPKNFKPVKAETSPHQTALLSGKNALETTIAMID
jgi:alpha-tubulin suppressor-like RCC1 family protein